MIPVNTIVKFSEPQTEDERTERFVVVENRGERVLVAALCEMTIKPTFVYLCSELETVKD